MIEIEHASLNLEEVAKIIFKDERIELSENVVGKINESYNFLNEFSKNKVIYGINTGFGPMAQYKIEDADQIKLQYNLIRIHSSGFGKYLEPNYAKAAVLARLNTLSLGYSGVNITAIRVLQELINKDVTPLIFEHGGVGASGDLVQLAHLGLVMIGEGQVIYKGEIHDTADIFKQLDITPMTVKLREGLGIMNGTSVMTGIGLINSIYAKRAIEWSLACTIMICEMVDSYDDYFSKELNQSKKHVGQQDVARVLYQHITESKYIRKKRATFI